MRYAFRLVDVFTERPLAGNQLAVVLDVDGLDAQQMQAIAREFNFSETSFVSPSRTEGCDWRVRIFTPVQELPMAGHPTIGTAVVLEALGRVSERTVFELGVGPTPVGVQPGWAEMDQRPPTFGALHPDPAALASALSIDAEEITATGLAPQSVSTGLAHLIVPVRSLAAARRMKPRADELEAALTGFPGAAAYCFTREVEQPGSDAHCRMFAPHVGTVEDPATGSAAGPLACYLARYVPRRPPSGAPTPRNLRFRGDPGDGPPPPASGGGSGQTRFRFEQGFEMGRPSLLEATVELAGGAVAAVRVGGAARIVGEGWLTL